MESAKQKKSVSVKKSQANTTFNTLTNLPKSIRRSDLFTPSSKKLLNYFLSLRHEWDDPTSFFRANNTVMAETEMDKRSFKRARGVLVDNKVLTYSSTGVRGEATVYKFNIEIIGAWCDEKEREILGNSMREFRGASKGCATVDNTLNENTLQGCTLGVHSETNLGVHLGVQNEDDNQPDDNDMTKFEMQCKIFAVLEEIKAENQYLKEQLEGLRADMRTLLDGVNKGCTLGVQNGVQNETECTPNNNNSTITSTIEKEIYKEKAKANENENAHTRVDLALASSSLAMGVEKRNADTHTNEGKTDVCTRFAQLHRKATEIVGEWNNTHDSIKAKEEITRVCAEVKSIKAELTREQWEGFKSYVNGFKQSMDLALASSLQSNTTPQPPYNASQPVSTPQTINHTTQCPKVQGNGSQVANQGYNSKPMTQGTTAQGIFDAQTAAECQWRSDHNDEVYEKGVEERKAQMAELHQQGRATEKQVEGLNKKMAGFDRQFRGSSPSVVLDSDLKPFLTSLDVQSIENQDEYTKAVIQASQRPSEPLSEDTTLEVEEMLDSVAIAVDSSHLVSSDTEGILAKSHETLVKITKDFTESQLQPYTARIRQLTVEQVSREVDVRNMPELMTFWNDAAKKYGGIAYQTARMMWRRILSYGFPPKQREVRNRLAREFAAVWGLEGLGATQDQFDAITAA